MAENKKICDFADRWNRKFRQEDTAEWEVEEALGRECQALGFSMDCGQAFRSRYGEDAFYRLGAFRSIAHDISDEMLLGSAIYSKWRYCTHWSRESILSRENRDWFCCALYRLSLLTQENWQKSWQRQAEGEDPVLRDIMLKTLDQFQKQHPED